MALLVVSALLVAVTVTAGGVGTAPGAWYRPAALIVPSVVLPPWISLTLQVTRASVVPSTVAANGCLPAHEHCRCLGVQPPVICGSIVTVVSALLVVSATLVAVMSPWWTY